MSDRIENTSEYGGIKPPWLDYQFYTKARQELMRDKANDANRFESIMSRNDSSKLPSDFVKIMEAGKYSTDWRGVGMCKDPFDVLLYQAMVWDNRPGTIIEIGSLEGGAAMWLADLVKLFGISCRVYSVDIDLSLLDQSARDREDITFLQGDCNQIEKTFTQEMLESFPHPWMIIEDAHVNFVNVLEYFYKFMTPGDYVIVEDTHPGCRASSDFVSDDHTGDPGKLSKTREFVERHPDELKIDTFYNDRFGYNATWNVNGFIRRV